MKLNEKQLLEITGGWSAAMFSAIVRAANSIYSFGQSVGSSIRRLFSRSYC